MFETTIGQLLINDALPPELRDYNRVLDKGGIRSLLSQLADSHPDKYRSVLKRVTDVARDAATSSGGYSFGIRHLQQPASMRQFKEKLQQELQKIYVTERDPENRNKQVLALLQKERQTLSTRLYDELLKAKNPLAGQVRSGSRGNPSNLNSLLGADLTYTDHRDREIPIPVLRSYSQGLRPEEYFAGAFGARKGIYDVKAATQNAGYLGKQVSQIVHRLVVSRNDAEDRYDETNPRGYPVAVSDPDSAGALLAHPVGGYRRNTTLTPRILKDLRDRGIEDILVRSPAVGGPEDGGVYANDVGVRERGRIPGRGEFVGITAGQAITELLTQAQLSSKHSGGVAGATAGAVSGFKAIDAMLQVPKVYPGGATHAQVDGRVSGIRPAPQGGVFLKIEDTEHYVPTDAEARVKLGDVVEAGDVLSTGVPNPAEIVKFKGVGEGRRYFVGAFRDTLRNSGISANRRNIELLARGAINHVRLSDEIGDWGPDDVLPYQYLESRWQPRPGTVSGTPKHSAGQYLERPVLHYTIGTKLRPSVVANLNKYGVTQVHAHREPPPFAPEMIRGMTNVTHDMDWMSRLLGGYQEDSLLSAAHRGDVSDEAGTSFVPALARGEGFGITGATAKTTPAGQKPLL